MMPRWRATVTASVRAANLELAEDVLDVVLDGVVGDLEVAADFLVGLAVRDFERRQLACTHSFFGVFVLVRFASVMREIKFAEATSQRALCRRRVRSGRPRNLARPLSRNARSVRYAS